MKQLEVNNNKIAKFLGWKQDTNSLWYTLKKPIWNPIVGSVSVSQNGKRLAFHEDFNWLMKAVEKCLGILEKTDYKIHGSVVHLANIHGGLFKCNIKELYSSTIKCIDWINDNKL